MAATTDPLDRLAAAEAYLEAQEALGERLRDGFWALAKAKLRVGQAWAGPEYCREELGAARRVHQRQQQGCVRFRWVRILVQCVCEYG